MQEKCKVNIRHVRHLRKKHQKNVTKFGMFFPSNVRQTYKMTTKIITKRSDPGTFSMIKMIRSRF